MNDIIILEIAQYGNNNNEHVVYVTYVIKKCDCQDLYINGSGSSCTYRCYCTYVKQMKEHKRPFFLEHNIDIEQQKINTQEYKECRELVQTLIFNHLKKYFEHGSIELQGNIFDFTKEQIEAAIIAEKLSQNK